MQHIVDLASPLAKSLLSLYESDPWLEDATNQSSNQLQKNWQGFWLRGSQVYMPAISLLNVQIFEEMHDSKYADHYGMSKLAGQLNRCFGGLGCEPRLKGMFENVRFAGTTNL
jgi:hypothetical protein